MHECRGVTKLDGVSGKKQVWRSMFEPEVFQKQTYCIEANTYDILGTFRHPRSASAPGELCHPCMNALQRNYTSTR